MENRILSVGSNFPAFNKRAVASSEVGKEFTDITLDNCLKGSKWMVMFWWPMDFTFVCPMEDIWF
jgi:peroxiredoxin (alkyl hydroperoxide reductase subunit C)